MEALAALKRDNGPSERFLHEIIDFQGIIGGIMSVIHPEQHFEGCGAFLSRLHSKAKGMDDEACFEWLMKVWGTGFTGLSVFSERETPLHRDGQNADWMYDLLVNISLCCYIYISFTLIAHKPDASEALTVGPVSWLPQSI